MLGGNLEFVQWRFSINSSIFRSRALVFPFDPGVFYGDQKPPPPFDFFTLLTLLVVYLRVLDPRFILFGIPQKDPTAILP